MLAACVCSVHTFSGFRRQWLKAYDFVAQEIPTIKSVWVVVFCLGFSVCLGFFVGPVNLVTWNSFLPFPFYRVDIATQSVNENGSSGPPHGQVIKNPNAAMFIWGRIELGGASPFACV